MKEKNIKLAQQRVKEMRESGTFTQGNPLSKGLNSQSLRDSIDAHCYMCMGGEIEGRTKVSVMRDVRNCDSPICPLNTVRPGAGDEYNQ